MNLILSIAGGGALGAVMRHYAVLAAATLWGAAFPYGTLLVNIVGSFLIGVIVETGALKWQIPLEMRAFLVTGFLGGFTTFSAFSLDTLKLVETGQGIGAFVYVLLSVALSLGAAFAGLCLVRGILS